MSRNIGAVSDRGGARLAVWRVMMLHLLSSWGGYHATVTMQTLPCSLQNWRGPLHVLVGRHKGSMDPSN
jgi:hypothetical protein